MTPYFSPITPDTPELQRYIKRAVRGLDAKERQIVATELRQHVMERARRYELLGLSTSQAQLRALEHMGVAEHLNVQLLQVHTPRLLMAGLLTLLIGLTAMVILNYTRVTAVQVTATAPNGQRSDFATFDLHSFEAFLRAQGVPVERNAGALSFQMPDHRQVTLPQLQAEDGPARLPADRLITQLSSANVAFRLTGWNALTLHVADLNIPLSTGPDASRAAYNLYAAALLQTLHRTPLQYRGVEFGRSGTRPYWLTQRVAVPSRASVVGIVGLSPDGRVFIDVAPTRHAPGEAEFMLPAGAVRVVQNWQELSSSGVGGRPILVVPLS